MKYATRIERFTSGDFPLVCAHSGETATYLVGLHARRTSVWPWLLFPGVAFFLAWLVDGAGTMEGALPSADGGLPGVTARYDRGAGIVMLRGVHPEFVAATKAAQGRMP
ncbi:MAG: hypothetical protein AAGD35_12240 [Actinomycetota bacterium]